MFRKILKWIKSLFTKTNSVSLTEGEEPEDPPPEKPGKPTGG
jgi:hypothetical protein